MSAQGVVVLPGQGSVWNVSQDRSLVLKLLGGATGGSIMLLEETVPAGTKSWFHLHHDSDEVAYVLSGEITFKIGDEVTAGGPGPAPSCRAGSSTPGRTAARKPEGCCSSTPGRSGWAG